MRWPRWLVWALALAPCAAHAQFDRFPQFRGLSGLSCGGYGVDSDGRASLTGPVALSTPTAHVLGHSQLRLQYGTISTGQALRGDSGHNNQTFVAAYGVTFGHVNVQGAGMVLSSRGDQAFNVQARLVPDSGARLVWSAGVQDITGKGGSAGEGAEGDDRLSRSLFAAATYRMGPDEHPWYLSGGVGTRRFGNGFASASVNIAKPVRLWVELDGFGVNLGMLVTGASEKPQKVEATGLVGFVAGRYFTIGVGVGF